MLGRAQGAFHYPWTKCHLRREEGRGSQASCPVHHCSMALPGTAVPRTDSSLIFSGILVLRCHAQAGHSPMCLPVEAGYPPTQIPAMGLPSWQETLTFCEGSQSYHAVSEAPGFTLCHCCCPPLGTSRGCKAGCTCTSVLCPATCPPSPACHSHGGESGERCPHCCRTPPDLHPCLGHHVHQDGQAQCWHPSPGAKFGTNSPLFCLCCQ